MEIYEIKKNFFDSILSIYEQQCAILTKLEIKLETVNDGTSIDAIKEHIEVVKSNIKRLEAELEEAEAEVKRWAVPKKIFGPPLSIQLGRSSQLLFVTAIDAKLAEPSFTLAKFGEVVVKADELEGLVNVRARCAEPIPFMKGLRKSVMLVGRIEREGLALGTGILLNRNQLLTNWHVVSHSQDFENLIVSFGHFLNEANVIEYDYVAKVKKLLASSDESLLDYALLEIEDFGKYDNLINPASNIAQPVEDRIVNMLHYPHGQPLSLSTQGNWVKKVQGEKMLYFTGTEPGSSGAPIFNDNWELIALHRSNNPFPPANFLDNIQANEAILISAIFDDLKRKNIPIA